MASLSMSCWLRGPTSETALPSSRNGSRLLLAMLLLASSLPSLPTAYRHRVRTSYVRQPPPPEGLEPGQTSPSGTTYSGTGYGGQKSRAAETHSSEEAAEQCKEYEPLYQAIYDDLARWKETGIDEKLMDDLIRSHTTRTMAQKGIALGFKDGVAYVVDKPVLMGWVGHHPSLFFVYMKAMLHLQHTFGRLIPDVEFVISTIDRPLQLASECKGPCHPVMRFCKSDSHADILVPIFHFYMKHYTSEFLNKASWFNKEFPWETKKPVLFGRFSPYLRHMHPNDSATQRQGAGGSTVCTVDSLRTMACPIRRHFMDWARAKAPKRIDVNGGHQPMYKHAQYKYLVHLDGQGLSSRLDLLLPLGSVVLKEESGYRAFYHHLLQPYKHFLPFWKKVPEEALEVLDWADSHDQEARSMAQASQEFALKYLSRSARACYWLRLLTEFSKLLRYKPGPPPRGNDGNVSATASKYRSYYVTVEEYLRTEARGYDGGKWLSNTPFEP